jgi:hypothetical protein
MSAHNRTVRHHAFHIGVIAEIVKQVIENTMFTPASETFVNTVPFAVFLRQQSPLSTAPEHPKRRFDESSALFFLTYIDTWVVAQKLDDLLPLVIA